MPVFKGPHQNRPWVIALHKAIYGRWSLSFPNLWIFDTVTSVKQIWPK